LLPNHAVLVSRQTSGGTARTASNNAPYGIGSRPNRIGEVEPKATSRTTLTHLSELVL
jgi:hypothetical protein